MTKTKQLPSGDPRELGFAPERLGRIGRTMDAAVAARAIPGTVTVVARKGQVVHTHVTGKLDLDRPEKLSIDSLFRMYSQTKPVTAAVLMTLFEDGAFLLDRAGVEMDTGIRESESGRLSPGARARPRAHRRRLRSGAPRNHYLRLVDDDLRCCGKFAHALSALADAAWRVGGNRLRSWRHPLQRSDQRLR